MQKNERIIRRDMKNTHNTAAILKTGRIENVKNVKVNDSLACFDPTQKLLKGLHSQPVLHVETGKCFTL